MTHKLENNNAKVVLPQLWRFWAPCQAPSLRAPAMGLGIPREFYFEGQQDLIKDFHRTGGNRDSTLEGHAQNLVHSKTQGKGEATPQKFLLKIKALFRFNTSHPNDFINLGSTFSWIWLIFCKLTINSLNNGAEIENSRNHTLWKRQYFFIPLHFWVGNWWWHHWSSIYSEA